MAFLIIQALALIGGVVIVVLAGDVVDKGRALSAPPRHDYQAEDIAIIVVGVIYAIAVGKFSSNLII